MTRNPKPELEITARDVAKGAGTTLLARLGGAFEVIAQPAYVAMFGLAGYGLYTVLWAAVNITENVLDLGMAAGLQRVIPQSKTPEDEVAALRAAFLIGLIPCIAVAVLASLGASYLASLVNAADADAARVALAIGRFSWSLPLWCFIEISTSALRSKRLFGAEIRLRLFWEQVIRLLMATSLFIAGVTTMALFYAHLASLAIICLLCVRLLARHFELTLLFKGPVFGAPFRVMLKSGLSVWPVNIASRLFADGPPIILNWMLPGAAGAVSAGLYAIARKVSSIVQLVRTAFGYVLVPLASAASQGEAGRVREMYAFVTRLSFALAVPLGTVLAASGPTILRGFGTGAAVALPALVILIVSRMIEAVNGAAAPILQVTGGYANQLTGSAVGLAASFGIGAVMLPAWGLTGMAIAVSVGVVIAAVLPLAQLHIYDRLHPFNTPFPRVMLRGSVISLAGLALALGVQILPLIAQPVLLPLILLATIWASARYALPHADRALLGKAGRVLRLV